MTGPSLCWIDWRLAGSAMRRETAARFVAFLFLSFLFLALLFSGGTNRFLSRQWTVTAILRAGVVEEEGQGLARKVSELPPVLAAEYRTPRQAWEEFSAQYPGLEGLRLGGRNPLPGYIEIRLRHDRLTEAGMEEVLSVLRPLPQVEKLLSGGEGMSRLLRWKRFANAAMWGGLGLLALLFFLWFVLQERGRASALAPDFAFLCERGVDGGRIAARRAGGAAATAFLLCLAAVAAAATALYLLSERFRAFRLAVGGPDEVADPGYLLPLALFLLAGTLLPAAASLIGWRFGGAPGPK